MLEELIKRDGTIEARDDSKIMGWAEWSAHFLGNRVDYVSAANRALDEAPARMTTRALSMSLIDKLMAEKTYPAYLMAGRLYAVVVRKDIFGSLTPLSVIQQHTKLMNIGLMRKLDYNYIEYMEVERMIDHSRDYFYPEFSIRQIQDKYAIRNHNTKVTYETPQFVYMRLAMTLSEKKPKHERMYWVRRYYEKFSMKKLSAPTPNYLYLGTNHRGYASCCIFVNYDTVASISIANHIGEMMTANSAGLGSFSAVRTVGDPVAKGRVKHGGMYRYEKAKAGVILSNKQAARAGAGTSYVMCYHPEAPEVVNYRNPLIPENRQNRDLHYGLLYNKFFFYKMARQEQIFTFTIFTAPDLFELFFQGKPAEFKALYEKYEADPNFVKNYIDPAKLVGISFAEAYNTGTAYLADMDEANHHTPFIIEGDKVIHSPNLCGEVFEVNQPYYDMRDLYSEEDHGRGEIAMCNLAAIPVENIESDAEYEDVCELALDMILYTTNEGVYPFPHLALTAKARRNAGVGIMGLATYMARKDLKWNTTEGKQELHRVFERHYYFLLKASLKISKVHGNAPWMHKTKWSKPGSWLPIDTYNRSVDEIAEFEYQYDWEEIRQQVIANGGHAFTVLCNFMPGESSSKALGSTNAHYPIRRDVIVKTDGDGNIIRWAAVDHDLLEGKYTYAYEMTPYDLIDCYAIAQKFCDQGASNDLYRRFKPGEASVPMEEVLNIFAYIVKRGLKSRYYTNTERPRIRKSSEMDIATTELPEYEEIYSGDHEYIPEYIIHGDHILRKGELIEGVEEETMDDLPEHEGSAFSEAYVVAPVLTAAALPAPPITPKITLNLDLLGSATGVAPVSAQIVEYEEQEILDSCTDSCKL